MSDSKHIVAIVGAFFNEQEAGRYTVEQALEMVTHSANRLKLQDALNQKERPIYRVYTTNPYELRLQRTR